MRNYLMKKAISVVDACWKFSQRINKAKKGREELHGKLNELTWRFIDNFVEAIVSITDEVTFKEDEINKNQLTQEFKNILIADSGLF